MRLTGYKLTLLVGYSIIVMCNLFSMLEFYQPGPSSDSAPHNLSDQRTLGLNSSAGDVRHTARRSGDNIYFSVLPGTHNLWTLADIRRGSRNRNKQIIGVRSVNLDMNIISDFYPYHLDKVKNSVSHTSTFNTFSSNGNFDFVNPSQVIRASDTNRTKSESRILIYNRVPKCASTTMNALISRLRKTNRFRHETSKIYWK